MKCSKKFKKLSDAKIAYHTLSRMLHPDKNLHKGATEAFKILQDANDKLMKKEPLSRETLEIKEFFDQSTTAPSIAKPPKVISVQTKKKLISRITTLSGKQMDFRAKLSTASNTPDALSEHIKKVLNNCWEKREKNGDIPVPDEDVMKLSCLKQIKSSFHWLKELRPDETFPQGAELIITVKEVRERTDDSFGWKDSLEVDLEDSLLNSKDSSKFTGECVWKRWILMKEYIDKLFNENDEYGA